MVQCYSDIVGVALSCSIQFEENYSVHIGVAGVNFASDIVAVDLDIWSRSCCGSFGDGRESWEHNQREKTSRTQNIHILFSRAYIDLIVIDCSIINKPGNLFATVKIVGSSLQSFTRPSRWRLIWVGVSGGQIWYTIKLANVWYGARGEREPGEDKLLLIEEIFKLSQFFSSSEYSKLGLFFKERFGQIPELLGSSRSVQISLKNAVVLPLPKYQSWMKEYCCQEHEHLQEFWQVRQFCLS